MYLNKKKSYKLTLDIELIFPIEASNKDVEEYLQFKYDFIAICNKSNPCILTPTYVKGFSLKEISVNDSATDETTTLY